MIEKSDERPATPHCRPLNDLRSATSEIRFGELDCVVIDQRGDEPEIHSDGAESLDGHCERTFGATFHIVSTCDNSSFVVAPFGVA